MPDRERFLIVLEAGPDPAARWHGADRDPAYRLRMALKRLLRDHGLKPIDVRPVLPTKTPTTDEHLPDTTEAT